MNFSASSREGGISTPVSQYTIRTVRCFPRYISQAESNRARTAVESFPPLKPNTHGLVDAESDSWTRCNPLSMQAFPKLFHQAISAEISDVLLLIDAQLAVFFGLRGNGCEGEEAEAC